MQKVNLIHLQYYETNFEKHPPPRNDFDVPIIIHSLRELYAKTYLVGKQIPKADKLGIHKEIENKVIQTFSLGITAIYENPKNKIMVLERLRIELEVLKQLTRAEYEIHIITEKSYLQISKILQESSKQTNGWIKYLKTQNPTIQAGLF